MEPIAVGFMVLVGTAALLGVVVGAIGGAVAWGFCFGALAAGTASGGVGSGRLPDPSADQGSQAPALMPGVRRPLQAVAST